MRFAEILSEMQQGQIYKGGVSYDKSAPWVKKQMDVAAERTKAIDELDSPADKFKFIVDLGSKNVRNKMFARSKTKNDLVPLSLRSYDPETGDIVLSVSGSSLKTYNSNISTLEFIGRERSPSTSVKTYKFVASITGSEEKQSQNKLLVKKREEEAAKQAEMEKQRQANAHRKAQLDREWEGKRNYDDPWGYRR